VFPSESLGYAGSMVGMGDGCLKGFQFCLETTAKDAVKSKCEPLWCSSAVNKIACLSIQRLVTSME